MPVQKNRRGEDFAMRWPRVNGVRPVALAALVLVACGGRARSDADAGGAAVAGAAGIADGAGGDGGAGGEPVLAQPDISGRWAVVGNYDPLGVDLQQSDGSLTGSGCNVGAPPVQDPDAGAESCGRITGLLTGNHGSFDFTYGPLSSQMAYMVDVTASADGKRMTGSVLLDSDDYFGPVAWLRVSDGQSLLVATEESKALPAAVTGLELLDADTGATEYRYGTLYSVHLDRGTLSGDLGSFFGSELRRPVPGGPILVGPVSPTAPGLPVSMVIELSGKLFAKVTATTASNHHYTFRAVSLQ